METGAYSEWFEDVVGPLQLSASMHLPGDDLHVPQSCPRPLSRQHFPEQHSKGICTTALSESHPQRDGDDCFRARVAIVTDNRGGDKAVLLINQDN